MIAHSELGEALIVASDRGYNVLVGSRPGRLLLFAPYTDHPMATQKVTASLWSDAAGRYQIMSTWWPAYKKQLALPDFGPESQDRYAVQQIAERGALADVEAGRLAVAITKCCGIWASLPGAAYGQHVNQFADLKVAYLQAGGTVSG
jgi:muramidase (phage lysozyme)